MEVFARLVAAAVFKTVGRQDKLVFGGFDSHTLPPFCDVNTMLIARARKCFLEEYGCEPEWIAQAPGRVNLLGEHVDYNGGLVLPMGIDRCTVVAARASTHSRRTVQVVSETLGQRGAFSLEGLKPATEKSWWSYVAGVIAQFDRNKQTGSDLNPQPATRSEHDLPGLDIAIVSNLPLGSGLSSSAALSVALSMIMNDWLGAAQSPFELARLCQTAEREFAGVPCGLMDPLCSAACKADHCMLIDCQTESFRLIPFCDAEITVLIADTKANRQLGAGAYAQRRRECEMAAECLGIRSLGELTPAKLSQSGAALKPTLVRRAQHVVEEIARVKSAAPLLEGRNWTEFGQLMNASHESLRDLFEVSCPELDAMVEIGRSIHGVLGTRMTGGGFGGCTVSLVESRFAEEVKSTLAQEYSRRKGIEPDLFFTRPSVGAKILKRPMRDE